MLTKTDLTEEIARATEMTKRDAKFILEAILDSMVKALDRGEGIEIRRFGSFGTHWRAPRTRLNPRTLQQVEVPARRVPHFRPSRELIALVNGLGDTNHSRDERPAADELISKFNK